MVVFNYSMIFFYNIGIIYNVSVIKFNKRTQFSYFISKHVLLKTKSVTTDYFSTTRVLSIRTPRHIFNKNFSEGTLFVSRENNNNNRSVKTQK